MTGLRIRLLALAAGGTVVVAGVGLTAPAATAVPSSVKGDVKNVIYLLGDGMGRTHVTAGRERFYGAAGKLNMERLPVVGQVSTYSVEPSSAKPNAVTDSASAATAWASGVKTYNAALGVDAYGHRVPTLMELAKAKGLRTGNVSTAEVTDATPAGMMSHALLRGCQGPYYSAASCQPSFLPAPSDPTLVMPISQQIATNNVADVIFGGGLQRFVGSMQDSMVANGYEVLGDFGSQTVATRSDLSGVNPGDKVIGLFNRGNLTIELAKQQAAAKPAPDAIDQAILQEPTLAELTTTAIDTLTAERKGDSNVKKSKGFLLQVEGALIDKRSHANDASQTLEEIKAFDDAVKVARDFAAKDGHTLVIVTADHECAGFNIIEKKSITNAESSSYPGTGNSDSGNAANSPTRTGTGPARTGSQAKDPNRSVGFQNDSAAGTAKVDNFAPATFGTPDDGANYRSLDGTADASLWLTYLSGNHTGADVPLFAYGPQSGRLAGSIDNTDLFTVMGNALGLQ